MLSITKARISLFSKVTLSIMEQIVTLCIMIEIIMSLNITSPNEMTLSIMKQIMTAK